jgi:hypothetical protein
MIYTIEQPENHTAITETHFKKFNRK